MSLRFWDSAPSATQVANIYSSGTSGSTPIPVPPSTAYWAPGAGVGGTDTWNGSQGTAFWAPNSNGSGTKHPRNNGLASSVAVFGGTAGTVTTSGTVQSNQFSFTTSGYTVAGGTGYRVEFIGSSPPSGWPAVCRRRSRRIWVAAARSRSRSRDPVAG